MRGKPVVLVGIDYSDSAAAAVAEARTLCQRLEAELEVLHVSEGYGNAKPHSPLPEEVAWLRAAGVDPANVVSRSGLAWVETARRAEEVNADFVVVGSHGRSGYNPLTLGSTALRMAMMSSRPLLLVNARVATRHRCTPSGDGKPRGRGPMRAER